MASSDLAATYAALILADEGLEITHAAAAAAAAATEAAEVVKAQMDIRDSIDGMDLSAVFMATSTIAAGLEMGSGDQQVAVAQGRMSEKIVQLTTAAGAPVEPIWATLMAKALEGKDVKELLTNVGAGGASVAVAAPAGGAAAAGGAAEEAKEDKKEEEKEESDDDMGFGLFD
ncbi:60S acidic ribosomal protein P1 [Moesziomyces antarcticus]|uniref:60S acidic ribosomal protein P1 n=1 Tax=Pseudozyma antarctica TaxID=84753 RepID=UPI00071986C3|nr:60S acidic ribosomal protein P1 [Moesziomyces antarcticus]GAK62424.1 60S acidic ribosomal protein P1 [Moesziomyces antarcticus]